MTEVIQRPADPPPGCLNSSNQSGRAPSEFSAGRHLCGTRPTTTNTVVMTITFYCCLIGQYFYSSLVCAVSGDKIKFTKQTHKPLLITEKR